MIESLSSRAKDALEDPFLWGNWYWGLTLEEKPHRWMCEELAKTLTMEVSPHLILDVPRGCYKTSIVTMGAVWQYLRQLYLYDNPYWRLLYASNTLELGEEFLTVIENVLRSGGLEGRIDEDYGPLWKYADKQDRRTSRRKNGLVLLPRIERGEIASVKEPTFFIASIRRRGVGGHADAAILDDLNNPDNVATPDQLKKTHDFYRQVYPLVDVKDRLGHSTHIWMTCTPWHDNDVRGMVIREEEEKRLEDPFYLSPWRILRAKARQDDGTLFFPTKLSEAKLKDLRDKMGPKHFGAAYEGDPVTTYSSVAEEEQIRYRDRDTFPALRWGRICVDPNQHSDAQKQGCYAAVVMGGYDQYAKLWISDMRGSRDWDTKDLIKTLYDLQAEHPTWSIFIEESHMRHFDHAVNLEFVLRKERNEPVTRLRINWVQAPRNLSKYERWNNSLRPRFQSASIFFAREIAPSIKKEVEDELVRGSSARFNDFLDALAMMETNVTPRYKADGKGEVIQKGADPAAQKPRGFTFADAINMKRFR